MVEVYRATSLLEAQMIVDLLLREGMVAEIVGELLSGGTGELPCDGLMSVRVDDVDQPQAAACLRQWDADYLQQMAQPTEPAETASLSLSDLTSKQRAGLWAGAAGLFLGGVLVGAALIANYYRSPVTRQGIDHNLDGFIDEQFVYSGERLTQRLQDRNFDGQPDFLVFYDHRGLELSSQWDDDFDGNFERQRRYKRNVPQVELIDTDRDGFADRRIEFRHGVAQH